MYLYLQPDSPSSRLWKIAMECEKYSMSGRALKKLPIQVHARFLKKNTYSEEEYLGGLEKYIKEGVSSYSV